LAVNRKITSLFTVPSVGSTTENVSPVAADMMRLASLSCSCIRKTEPSVVPHACCIAGWSSMSSRVAFAIFPDEWSISLPWAMTSLARTAEAMLGECVPWILPSL